MDTRRDLGRSGEALIVATDEIERLVAELQGAVTDLRFASGEIKRVTIDLNTARAERELFAGRSKTSEERADAAVYALGLLRRDLRSVLARAGDEPGR